MKGIASHVLGAVVLMVLSGGCLVVSMLDRQIAEAQQRVTTLQYDGVEEALDNVEWYFEYGTRLLWIGNGPLNDVRAPKAASQYWQRQYGSIIPQQANPVGVIAADNLELQLVVANAVYRMGRAEATDQLATLQAIVTGIDSYLTVLRNATRHETAAYNYEYLVRLRDDIEDGGDLSEDEEGKQNGAQGGAPLEEGTDDFQIRVPLENEEMGDPGSGSPIQRQG